MTLATQQQEEQPQKQQLPQQQALQKRQDEQLSVRKESQQPQQPQQQQQQQTRSTTLTLLHDDLTAEDDEELEDDEEEREIPHDEQESSSPASRTFKNVPAHPAEETCSTHHQNAFVSSNQNLQQNLPQIEKKTENGRHGEKRPNLVTATLVNLRNRLLPNFLFREVPPQNTPDTLPTFGAEPNPWLRCQEDEILQQMWLTDENKVQQRLKLQSIRKPSMQTLLRNLRLQRLELHNTSSAEDGHNNVSSHNSYLEKQRLISITRNNLEQQGRLRDIDELKIRAETLVNLKQSLTNRDIFRLTGTSTYPSCFSVVFPLFSQIRKSLVPPHQTLWAASHFSLDEMSLALKSFSPPLFVLPPFPSEPHSNAQAPLVRVPLVVLEHIALVIELQIKYILTLLTARMNGSSITLEDLETFIRDGGLSTIGMDNTYLLMKLRLRSFNQLLHTQHSSLNQNAVQEIPMVIQPTD